jgi:PKD repeat protein
MISLRHLFLISALILKSAVAVAQISGCTDPQSTNYNPAATINDGSCTYPPTNLSLTDKVTLSTPLLNETSGIAFLDGKLWTFCDSGNPNDIYRIDTTTNTVFQTVDISNATNVDWEDMTTSEDHLFIGDFGNNNGNRQNLKIYRINKNDLASTATSVTASVIQFSYSDQTSFPSLPNNNNFDCEAMIFLNDSIHLFSKNWIDNQTKHYVLPNIPGTHIAQYRETYNTGFLVTSATVQKFGVISLIGYLRTGTKPVSMCLLYDYKNHLFFNGNKRKFDLSTQTIYGQVEGVEFFSSSIAYVTNELYTTAANVPARLRTFNIDAYLPAKFLYPSPIANFSIPQGTACQNTSVQYSDQSQNTPTSWQWSFPGGNPSSSTQQNPNIQYSLPGTYSVTLITGNAAGYDTIIKSNFITIHPSPIASISAGGSTNLCQGQFVVLSANQQPGQSYQWRRNGTDIPGALNDTYQTGLAGNYDCLVSTTCGNQLSNLISVSTTDIPVTPDVPTGPTTACNNIGSAMYSISPVAGVTSYTWTVPSGALITSGQGGTTILVDFNGITQNGSVCVYASNNCGAGVASCLPVTILSVLPSKPASISGNIVQCAGSTGAVYSCALAANATAYNWIVPATTTIISGQGTNTIVVNFQSTFTTGTIKVSANNCVGNSAYKSISLRSKPAFPSLISGPTEGVCAGSTGVSYSIATSIGATQYNWTAPLNAIITSGQGTTNITVDFNSQFKTGTLKVSAENGCGISAVRNQSIRSKPVSPDTIVGPISVCSLQSGVIYSISPVSGASGYTWTVPSGSQITSGQNTNTIMLNYGLQAGSVKVKSNNSCGSSTNRTLQVIIGCRELEEENLSYFDPEIYPNPGDGVYNVLFRSDSFNTVSISLRELTGREIKRFDNIVPGTDFNIGYSIPAGVYIAEIMSGKYRKIIRLVHR